MALIYTNSKKYHNYLLTIIITLWLGCEKLNTNKTISNKLVAYNYTYSDSLLIDPADMPKSLLLPVTNQDSLLLLQTEFETKLKSDLINTSNYLKFTPILFTYRDTITRNLFRLIVKDTQSNLFIKMLSVYCLGECGNLDDFNLLYVRYTHPNSLYRQYIASALVKLTDSLHLFQIKQLAKTESNEYIRKTLISIDNSKHDSLLNKLSILDSTTFNKIPFFLKNKDLKNCNLTFSKSIDGHFQKPIMKHCIYPHQQYKTERALYQLLNYPIVSFGLEDHSWGTHVGEDSGWLFTGLSIHSIMDGVVVKIQYEPSWGCLIAIESQISNDSNVLVYYGHLSNRMYVTIGDNVVMGDKIGEIAPSFSIINGGYVSHLHIGIEKAAYSNALIKGWHKSIDMWYSPIAFIANNQNTKH
jgi:hypothetical protein